MLKVVITGGIASGKSEVGRLLRKAQQVVIDLDDLSQEVVALGSLGLSELVAEFGQHILNNDGSLNRAKLKNILFSNVLDKELIEAILHPKIISLMKQKMAYYEQQNARQIFIITPLLLEANLLAKFDKIVVIDCTKTKQIERLIARDNIDSKTAKDIIKNQASRIERLSIKNAIIIDNNGSLVDLENNFKQLLKP